VLDPRGLYDLTPEQPEPGELESPVLLFAIGGFVDAGQAGRLSADHLRESLEHRVLARFDLDQMYDYRARRPVMTFAGDHWESYEQPEPDVQWERFVAAVVQLVELYAVRLAIGVHAIPMAVPHTRPIGVTAHATDPSLVRGYEPWVGRVQVPGHMTGLLELRLGESGHDAAGFAVHVPHYLSQAEYPSAAEALLEAVSRLST
jgi:hypothetical protein